MIWILSGPVHSGKTSLLRKLAGEWKEDGIAFDGYLTPAVVVGGQTIGYDWFDLKTESLLPFLRTSGQAHWQRVGPFFFIPETLGEAKRKIAPGEGRGVLIVDEVGPLELQGKGVWPEVRLAAADSGRRLLLVVRRSLVGRLAEVLPNPATRVFEIEAPDLETSLSQFFREVRPSRAERKVPLSRREKGR